MTNCAWLAALMARAPFQDEMIRQRGADDRARQGALQQYYIHRATRLRARRRQMSRPGTETQALVQPDRGRVARIADHGDHLAVAMPRAAIDHRLQQGLSDAAPSARAAPHGSNPRPCRDRRRAPGMVEPSKSPAPARRRPRPHRPASPARTSARRRPSRRIRDRVLECAEAALDLVTVDRRDRREMLGPRPARAVKPRRRRATPGPGTAWARGSSQCFHLDVGQMQ